MENLKGKNIISRMNELMYYGKSTSKPVKEGRNWASLEYSIKAPDGKTYGILRDQTKFYIKESKNDNPTIQDFNFIDGDINGSKKYYNNYSHALNYLNLMIAEMNQKNPKAKAINLLESCSKETSMEESKKEKEVDEKTILKVPKEQPAAQPAPAMAPKQDTGLDLGGKKEPDMDLGGDEDVDLGGDEDMDLGGDEDMGDEEAGIGEDDETKAIQKLTGKLGQKMRELDQPDNDLTKYVMNSVMSALDLQDLEDSDQKQIMKKIKKKMSGEGEMESQDTGDEDMDLGGDEDTGSNEGDVDLFGDMGDEEGGDNEEKSRLTLPKKKKEEDLAECDAPFGEKKEPQNIKTANAPFNEKPKTSQMESKINKVLSNYFEYTPEEKKRITESNNKAKLLKEGKEKCNSIEQELSLRKALNYDKTFTIKTMNENVILDPGHKLVIGGKEYKKLIMIESNGKVSGILKDVETKTARQYRMRDKNDYINFKNLGKSK